MTRNPQHSRANSRLQAVPRRRRGVAVVVALGLLAVTLTVSYTLLRTQATAQMIQRNAAREHSARHAAMAGMSVALRKIHEPDWQGVAVPLTGEVGPLDSFEVTFTTGDAELAADHDDYQEYPYRLTIRSTGTSVDPADPDRRAEHVVEVVVQLVRERLAPPPPDWEDLLANTLTQWDDEAEAEINIPCRIEGPARIRGELAFSPGAPTQVRPFDGLIDEVAVLANVLSWSQLRDIYLGASSYGSYSGMRAWWRLNETAGATLAVDQTGNAHGIYEGATPGEAAAPFGGSGSARFDGEVDGIAVGSLDVAGGQLTIMAWFKADDFGSNYARIISKSVGTDENDHWWMLSTVRSGPNQRLRFRVKNLFGSTKTLVASSGNLAAGEWVFAAATYDGFTMRLYRNGELVGQTSHFGPVMAVNPSVPVWIGDNAPGSSRGLYFRHQNQMAAAGYDDQRALSGPLTVRSESLDSASRLLLSEELGVELVDEPNVGEVDYARFVPPNEVSSYRLYPGGTAYEIPQLGAVVANQQLEPDVVTNPLGVFHAPGNVDLKTGLRLQGALLAQRDVDFDGTGIVLSGIDLPPLAGSGERVQLPCLCAGRRARFRSDSVVEGEGMLVVGGETRLDSDDSTMKATLTGKLATGGLDIAPRSPWAGYNSSAWNSMALEFQRQRNQGGGIAYFPEWLEDEGLSSNPHFTLKPSSDTIRFHWHDWSQPLFLPKTDDEGLRWNLIRWTDHG